MPYRTHGVTRTPEDDAIISRALDRGTARILLTMVEYDDDDYNLMTALSGGDCEVDTYGRPGICWQHGAVECGTVYAYHDLAEFYICDVADASCHSIS